MASGYNLRENFLEESFILQKHLGMSYSEIKNLPISYRRWYIDRLIKHFKSINEKKTPVQSNKQQHTLMGMDHNDKPDPGESADLKKVERFFKKFSKE